MNLDGWAGGGMSLEHYQSKSDILENIARTLVGIPVRSDVPY